MKNGFIFITRTWFPTILKTNIANLTLFPEIKFFVVLTTNTNLILAYCFENFSQKKELFIQYVYLDKCLDF